ADGTLPAEGGERRRAASGDLLLDAVGDVDLQREAGRRRPDLDRLGGHARRGVEVQAGAHPGARFVPKRAVVVALGAPARARVAVDHVVGFVAVFRAAAKWVVGVRRALAE